MSTLYININTINIMSTQYHYHRKSQHLIPYHHRYHFFHFQSNYHLDFRSSFLDEFTFLPDLGVVNYYAILEHEHHQLIVSYSQVDLKHDKLVAYYLTCYTLQNWHVIFSYLVSVGRAVET